MRDTLTTETQRTRRLHREIKIKLEWPKAFVPFVLFCGLLCFAQSVRADDGYRLWLRYDQLSTPVVHEYRRLIKSISVQGNTDTFDVIRRELSAGCTGLLGTPVIVGDSDDASVIVGVPES